MSALYRLRRTAAIAAVSATALAPFAARALDAPHDSSSAPAIGCTSCHTMHNALGNGLTSASSHANLCGSCHNKRSGVFGLPWVSGDQAVGDVSGRHHRWDGLIDDPAHGASMPLDANLDATLGRSGGQVSCGVCHDVHKGAASNPSPSHQHVSVALGAPLARMSGAGTGTVAVTSVGESALAKGHVVRIVAGGPVGVATFQVSNDNGTTWFGWNATTGAWGAGIVTGRPIASDGVVALKDPAVIVTFSGSDAASFVGGTGGDRWQGFYVSYPSFRAPNSAGQMCEDCHRSWVQSVARVEGLDPDYPADGVNVFSHPNGPGVMPSRSYDRVQPLEPDGSPQGGEGDGIRSNDLALNASGEVRCLTCHSGAHEVDSNGLTEDR